MNLFKVSLDPPMSKEKIILSFVAAIIGLVVAGAAFYIYEGTRISPEKQNSTIAINPSPTPKPAVDLFIDEPKDEEVVDSAILKISGKTDPSATVVVLTDSDQDVVSPSETGSFTTTVNLNNGVNFVKIISILKNGLETSKDFTVTYSTESF